MEKSQNSLAKALLITATRRLSLALLAIVFLLSLAVGVLDTHIKDTKYQLSGAAQELAGQSAADLRTAISRDPQTGDLIFKKEILNQQPVSGQIKNKEGQYSVTIKNDPKEGISYYDPDSKQSFTIKPNFEVMQPRVVDQHVVIPLSNASSQQILTFKGNGLKEDLVLNVPQGDSKEFSYTLDLPASLEARLEDSGEIGIYTGTEQGLFGSQISYGSDHDRELVEKAQAKAKKDKLVFLLPAPEIAQAGGDDLLPETRAHFELKANTLTVKAEGLSRLKYPVSIDPSAIITSANDFNTGNDEGDVNFDSSSNQIKRAEITGGDITSSSGGTSPLNNQRSFAAVVAYNNRIYAIGGCTAFSTNCTTATGDVEMATITPSTGAIGTWDATTSTDLPVAWYSMNAAVYNGYVYVSGGVTAGASPSVNDTVYYAKISPSDGKIGTWNTTDHMGTARANHGLVATNGYLYAIFGCIAINGFNSGAPYCNGNGGQSSATIEKATIRADGTVSGWSTAFTATGSLYCQAFCSQGTLVSGSVYNGHIYTSITNAFFNTNWISRILAVSPNDGALTEEVNQFASGNVARYVKSGYIYSESTYTPLQSKPTLTTTFSQTTTAGCTHSPPILYKNFSYCVGDADDSPATTVSRNTFGSVGRMTHLSETSNSLASGRQRLNSCAVVYDGYVYLVGGDESGPTMTNDVLSAPLTAEGGIGAWTSAATFTTGRTALGCSVHNGYLYVVGGYSGSGTSQSDVQYASVSAGTVGSFNTPSGKLPAAVAGLSTVVYSNADGNTYLYALGGCINSPGDANICASTATIQSTIYYSKLDADGDACGWTGSSWDCTADNGTVNFKTATGTLNSTLHSFGAVAFRDRLYVVGGRTGVNANTATADVKYTSLSASGGDITTTAGNWSGSNAMTSTRAFHSLAFWNGYLYAMTGTNSSNNNLASTEYAPIANDGSVGAWTAGPNASANWTRSVGIAYGGVMYSITGSKGGTRSRNYLAVNLNNGGPGLAGSISDNTDLPKARYGQAVAAYNGFLYVAGGFVCSDTSNPCGGIGVTLDITNGVLRSQIGADGTLGTWTADSSMTANRSAFALVAYNNVLYAMGGCSAAAANCSTLSSPNVEQATINSDGSLSSWATSANSFGTARYGLGATAYNGYLYIAGGCSTNSLTCSTVHNDIQYAAIDSNGDLGAWAATTSFTTARFYPFLTIYNGYLYVGGGRSTASSNYALNDMQYAALNGNGTVGSFTTEPHRLALRAGNVVISHMFGENGFLHAVNGAVSASVQSAPIGNSGALNGRWNTSSNLGFPGFTPNGIATYKGTTFIPGGLFFPLTVPDTYSFSTYTLPRQGTYSKLLDTDVDTTPVKLLVNGTNVGNASRPGTEGMGGLSIRYKSITNSGTSGYSTLINPGVNSILGTLFNYTAYNDSGVDRGVARGYLLTFIFDASQTATFPDSGGNFTTITDYIFWYHANPGRRLRGGKTFTNEESMSCSSSPVGPTCTGKALDAPPN